LGGQNILQPLALGKPILFGPHMQNFRDVAAMAVSSGAADVCASAEQLIAALKHIIAEPDERAERGERARALVQANLGASARYAAAIAAEVKSA
jgi:3-deoxy-D-manno-octulosonic-acid transferase